jgi:hypothetical protein
MIPASQAVFDGIGVLVLSDYPGTRGRPNTRSAMKMKNKMLVTKAMPTK